ncbi:MAG: hypothetical protein ACREQ9_00515, partial [Candidatus Binatia bacterium]
MSGGGRKPLAALAGGGLGVLAGAAAMASFPDSAPVVCGALAVSSLGYLLGLYAVTREETSPPAVPW